MKLSRNLTFPHTLRMGKYALLKYLPDKDILTIINSRSADWPVS